MKNGVVRCEAMLGKLDALGRSRRCGRKAVATVRCPGWVSSFDINLCGLHQRVVVHQLARKNHTRHADPYEASGGGEGQLWLWTPGATR
jgi:hypothetical protein